MRQKVKVASLRTIKNRSERITELEAALAEAKAEAAEHFAFFEAERMQLAEERRDRQAADVRANETIIELTEERARLDNAKRILCNLIRVNGGSPLDEEAALAAIDAAGEEKP